MPCDVLLVEDDERIRQALGLALGDEDCEVVEAASGEEALPLLTTTDVDVVLLEIPRRAGALEEERAPTSVPTPVTVDWPAEPSGCRATVVVAYEADVAQQAAEVLPAREGAGVEHDAR